MSTWNQDRKYVLEGLERNEDQHARIYEKLEDVAIGVAVLRERSQPPKARPVFISAGAGTALAALVTGIFMLLR